MLFVLDDIHTALGVVLGMFYSSYPQGAHTLGKLHDNNCPSDGQNVLFGIGIRS